MVRPGKASVTVMTHHRAHLVDRDGHPIQAVDLDCMDDDSAKKS
jgi:hypothetical protein